MKIKNSQKIINNPVVMSLLLIFIIIFCYYFIVRNLSISDESPMIIEDSKSEEKQILVSKDVPLKEIQKTNTNISNIVTNSEACLFVAKMVAENETKKTSGTQQVSVLKANFLKSTNNCYYKLQNLINNPMYPSVTISINYAPNNESIAFCTSMPNTGTSCYQNNYGSINESQFYMIEAQYLEN